MNSPTALALTAGEAHDNRLAFKLLSRLKSGTMLLADRGYDANRIRALAAERAFAGAADVGGYRGRLAITMSWHN
jgi:hypothetical protein